MIRITKIPVPENSLIAKSFHVIHYSDCYLSRFHSEKNIEIDDCINFFLFKWPWWVYFLLKIRNVLVAPFGLKSDTDRHMADASQKEIISKGAHVNFFEVWDVNTNEILLGIRDKHLDACFSIILNKADLQYEIMLSTTVHYHHVMGTIYFFLIKPFHILITRSQLSRMVRNYTK